MDMDPIRRKVTMKKVAGFHSLDFVLASWARFSFRKGFGMREVQNDACVTEGRELSHRTWMREGDLDAAIESW